MPILLLFIIVPILEMWLLIEVGSHIGALPTIGLVFLTAIVGLALLRHQGFTALTRAQHKMAQGEIPAQEMGEGLFLAVGGALLLTPGFITDAVGFSCLIPGVRQVLLAYLLRRVQVTQFRSHWQTSSQNPTRSRGTDAPKPDHPETLEGEFKRED